MSNEVYVVYSIYCGHDIGRPEKAFRDRKKAEEYCEMHTSGPFVFCIETIELDEADLGI